MKEAIQKAIEGGYVITDNPEFVFEKWNMCESHIFLNPLFWQALGKAEGWEGYMQEDDTREYLCYANGNLFGWQAVWHRFIDHLAAGKYAESFFKDLLTSSN